MRNMKLHRIIEYLKSVEFYHDTFDVTGEGIRAVLAKYGINDEFTAEELQVLSEAVYLLAEQNEFSQAVYLATNVGYRWCAGNIEACEAMRSKSRSHTWRLTAR